MEEPMRNTEIGEMEEKEEDDEMDRLIIIETEDDENEKNKVKSGDDVIRPVESDKDNTKHENSDDQTFKEDTPKIEKWDTNKETCLTLGSIGESVASHIERPVSSIQMEKWLKSYPNNMTTLLKNDALPPASNRKNLLEKTLSQEKTDVNLDIACPERLPSNLRNFRKNALERKAIEEEPVVIKNDINLDTLDISGQDRLPPNQLTVPKVEKPEDLEFFNAPPPSQALSLTKNNALNNVYQTNSSSIQTPEGIKKIEKWMNNKTKPFSKEVPVDEEKLYFVAVPRDFEVKLDKQVAEKNIEFLASKQSPAIKITDQIQTEQRLEHFHFNQPTSNPIPLPTPSPTISNPDMIQKNKIRSSNHVLLTPKTPQQILDTQAAVAPKPIMVNSKNIPNRYNLHLQPSPEPVIVSTSHSYMPNLQLRPPTSLYSNIFNPQLHAVQHNPFGGVNRNSFNPQLQPSLTSPNNYILNLQPTPEPLKVTTCISYNPNLQTSPQPEPVKLTAHNGYNLPVQPSPEPVTAPKEIIASGKLDSIQTEPERLVARKFTQHQMDYCGTPILLLNFYSKFTLLIPEKEEFVEEHEATVEVKTQHLGDKKKLTFIRFLFDSTNSEITAPVLHADHLDTGMELIRNQTPCVFLGQPFQNVENVQEPTESNSLKTIPSESSNFDANFSDLNKSNMLSPNNSKRTYNESFSPNKLLISPSSSVNSSSPIDVYQAVNADQPQTPLSLNPNSLRSIRKEPISKKFEESEISTPKSIRRIESWMNKSSSALAASSRIVPSNEHQERISTMNPAIKTLLLTPSPILKMLTAAPTQELSPLELPTIIPHQSSVSPKERQLNHQSSESMIDVQFKLPILTPHPRLQFPQIPISGDAIMGLQGDQSKISEKPSTYKYKYVQEISKTSPVAKQPKVPVVNVGSSPIIEMNVSCSDDEPPQKVCRFEPKPSCSFQQTDPPIPELIPVIPAPHSSPPAPHSSPPAPYSSPPSQESSNDDSGPEQNDPQTLGLFAELERRLNEPLPVPVEENSKDEITVISASDGEDMEDEEEDDEEYVEGDDSEDYVPVGDERVKSKAIKKDRPTNAGVVPRPGSTRGRLKNCDKISRWLVTLLRDPEVNPSVITWIRPEDGIFKIVNSQKLAVLWGKKKGNPNMDYSKLSRAMRYYYKTGELEVVNSRLTYRFGDRMTNWKPINPADPNFINTRTASPDY